MVTHFASIVIIITTTIKYLFKEVLLLFSVFWLWRLYHYHYSRIITLSALPFAPCWQISQPLPCGGVRADQVVKTRIDEWTVKWIGEEQGNACPCPRPFRFMPWGSTRAKRPLPCSLPFPSFGLHTHRLSCVEYLQSAPLLIVRRTHIVRVQTTIIISVSLVSLHYNNRVEDAISDQGRM